MPLDVWGASDREARRFGVAKDDQRKQFEIDRDRIHYSSAFHRLAGVTQIVRAGEADVFHTRQQHSVKVAQVGRRLAQNIVRKFPQNASRLGIDPEVVEAACLAHDLGHPPFGHAGESTLDSLIEKAGDSDGFEGNAQTFRVITRLSVRYADCDGLNLTRATLAACLKYPWLRDKTNVDRTKKWGAYRSDQKTFDFAREFHSDPVQTPEAALMDWADDIAYSVHDLEDFHRCGAIPWGQLLFEDDGEPLKTRTFDKWHGAPSNAKSLLAEAFERLRDILEVAFGRTLFDRYEGTREQRQYVRNLTSLLIGRYLNAAGIANGAVVVNETATAEVKILKQITRDYIISNPSLAAQQHGQKVVIEDLFKALRSSSSTYPKFLPIRLRYIWNLAEGNEARFAADCIASLTEREVVGLHGRLYGTASGSVLDPIVR